MMKNAAWLKENKWVRRGIVALASLLALWLVLWLAVGLGGIVSDGVRKSLSGVLLKGYTVICGLGGKGYELAIEAMANILATRKA